MNTLIDSIIVFVVSLFAESEQKRNAKNIIILALVFGSMSAFAKGGGGHGHAAKHGGHAAVTGHEGKTSKGYYTHAVMFKTAKQSKAKHAPKR